MAEEEVYIVQALAISGHGRKIHYSGEEVIAGNFEPGAVAGLLSSGAIKRKADHVTVGDNSAEEAAWAELIQLGKSDLKAAGTTAVDTLAKMKEARANSGNEGGEAGNTDSGEMNTGKKIYADITAGELKEYLKLHEVPFEDNAQKKELYSLYADHVPAAD